METDPRLAKRAACWKRGTFQGLSRFLPIGWLFGGIFLLSQPSWGQVEAEVSLSSGVGLTGAILEVRIDVDLLSSGEFLGSYDATLTWFPTVLEFLSFSGGTPPFDNPVVNDTNAATGFLTFADADPIGAGGGIHILEVTFQVLASPCVTTLLDLTFSSMSAAQTFTDLMPILQVQDGTTSVTDFFFNLQVFDPIDTILEWNTIAGAVSYDVIRGNLSELFDDGVAVRLGEVTCLEDNSVDTTTGEGTEPANPDTTETNPDTGMPLPDQRFFYLVRFHDGVANSTYGFTDQCARERFVDLGDCP